MKIILIRHGVPTESLNGWLRMDEMGTKVHLYNESSIIDEPNKDVLSAVKTYDFVVCSHLNRSIDSAKALGFNKIHHFDKLFREVDLPYFNFGKIRLPVMYWAYIYRVLSLFGFSLNGESLAIAKKRAKLAASELTALAKKHDKVVFVGHGFINRFIAKELLSMSWTGPRKLDSKHWGFSEYENII